MLSENALKTLGWARLVNTDQTPVRKYHDTYSYSCKDPAMFLVLQIEQGQALYTLLAGSSINDITEVWHGALHQPATLVRKMLWAATATTISQVDLSGAPDNPQRLEVGDSVRLKGGDGAKAVIQRTMICNAVLGTPLGGNFIHLFTDLERVP